MRRRSDSLREKRRRLCRNTRRKGGAAQAKPFFDEKGVLLDEKPFSSSSVGEKNVEQGELCEPQ